MRKYHPNEFVFENIDTKEKAYWLGFLFADGCILVNKNTNGIQLAIHPKEEGSVNKYIEFMDVDPTIKKFRNGIIFVRIISDKIVDDLISHGCVPRKSMIIELPSLDSRELYLAFLLGYYDGDGTVNTTRITTGSVKFLEQIKEKFSLQQMTGEHSKKRKQMFQLETAF